MGIICYSLQILFNFVGYSDMAIGLGAIFGFRFNKNFNEPYTAKSVQNFWRRWHISLSSGFRDYLYIPLGGNRKDPVRAYVNSVLVFALCGLWHGASWTFFVWGLYHGLFLCFEKIPAVKQVINRLPKALAHVYTMAVVAVGWVFFRSDTLSYGLDYISAMFGFHGFVSNHYYFDEFMPHTAWIAVVEGLLLCLIPKETRMWRLAGLKNEPLQEMVRYTGYMLLLFLSILFVASGTYNPFIYFRF